MVGWWALPDWYTVPVFIGRGIGTTGTSLPFTYTPVADFFMGFNFCLMSEGRGLIIPIIHRAFSFNFLCGGVSILLFSHCGGLCWGNTPPWQISSVGSTSFFCLGAGDIFFSKSFTGFPFSTFSSGGVVLLYYFHSVGISVGSVHPRGRYFPFSF